MKVKAKWPIKYGDSRTGKTRTYGPGEVFDVPPEIAKQLGESGSIELEPVGEATQDKNKTPTT